MKPEKSFKTEFDDLGFLHVRGLISASEINSLKIAAEAILTEDTSTDILKTEDGIPRKISYLFDKGQIFLEMLTHPAIMDIAMGLSIRPDWLVPTWEDMLIKPAHKGIPVQVHQDLALQTVSGKVFSIGIYLHDSSHNPVYFLPGSHKLGPLKRDQIKKIWNQRKREFQPVFAAPGDLVVHNVLTVHYSESNESPLERYTWYLEFRDQEELIQNQIWTQDWCLGRRAILYRSQLERQKKGLPLAQMNFPDADLLKVICEAGVLRFPHETDKVSYDFASPYNHFMDPI